MVRFVIALVMLGSIAGCVASRVEWRPDDPRLIRGAYPEIPETSDPVELRRYFEARRKQAKVALEKQVGEPFPDLTLINPRGKVVRLSSLRNRRVAVLAAIAPFVTTSQWMEEFASHDWEAPPGFDELVVLVSQGGDRSWRKQVKSCPVIYFVGWPLEGFLAEWNIYPTMYAVAADGTFEGSWSLGQQPVVGGAQSN